MGEELLHCLSELAVIESLLGLAIPNEIVF